MDSSWRSPNLNPLDFVLWGHVKNVVYRHPIDTEEHLRVPFLELVDLRCLTTLLCKPLIVVGICLFSLGREFWDSSIVKDELE
jgi:hypothetical protein